MFFISTASGDSFLIFLLNIFFLYLVFSTKKVALEIKISRATLYKVHYLIRLPLHWEDRLFEERVFPPQSCGSGTCLYQQESIYQ